MNEFTVKSAFVGFITFLSAVLATAIYLLLSSITYGLLLAMPSIASLSTVATYFATIGVIGLSCALVIFAIGLIISPFAIANWVDEDYLKDSGMLPIIGQWFLIITVFSLVGGILSSLGFSIPFFISILCGAPAFIISSFLSLSAANISFLAAGALTVIGFSSMSIMYVPKNGADTNFSIDPERGSENPLLLKKGCYDRACGDISESKRPASAPYDYRDDPNRMTMRDFGGSAGNNL